MSVDTDLRFDAKVERGPSCWLWKAGKAGAGYGHFHVGMAAGRRVTTYAHRYAYERVFGSVPAGLEIDHLCRNRLCVNPAHLEPVTHMVNRRRARGYDYKKSDLGPTCRHGHERTPENTGTNTYGYRFCRPCSRAATRRHIAKKKSL